MIPWGLSLSSSGADSLLRRDWTHMQILVEELRKHEWVHSLQFIDTAKVVSPSPSMTTQMMLNRFWCIKQVPVIKLTTVVDRHTILMDITFSFSMSSSSSNHVSMAEALADLPSNPSSLLRANANPFEHRGIGSPTP